jgi:hypothetical protein
VRTLCGDGASAQGVRTLVCLCTCVKLARTIHLIGIYGVYTVPLAGKSPYIRSYTVQIYGSGQPYTCVMAGERVCLVKQGV